MVGPILVYATLLIPTNILFEAALSYLGVGIVPPVGVQWKKSTGKFPFEMEVVDNSLNKNVKIQAQLEPTNA